MSTKTAPQRTTRTAKRRPVFQEPLIAEPTRPTDHNGIPVEREESLSNLPTGAPFKITRLHLANGEIAYSCRDCLFTGDTRGDVMAHRNAKHGTRYGAKRPKVVLTPAERSADVVLPAREDGPAPDTLLEMTLGEILALAPTIKALGDHIDRVEAEKDRLADDLTRNQIDRADQHKIDVYDALRTEVLDLRLKLRGHKDCDQLREQIATLKAWKRKIILKFNQLGFKLEEEE